MEVTKKDLNRLINYLLDIADGYSDDETFDMDVAEIENEILYNTNHEI